MEEYTSQILVINEDNGTAILEKRKLVGNTEILGKYTITHYKPVKPSIVYMRAVELYNGSECIAKMEVNEIEDVSTSD